MRMTIEEKREKLRRELLSIPVEKWDGFKTQYNGFDVTINRTHGGFAPYFMIDGYELRADYDLLSTLELRASLNEKDAEAKKLDSFLGL